MVNPNVSPQLLRLLELLKNKTLEASIERDRRTPGEISPTSVAGKGPEMVNLEVCSRLQRLLEILISKTVDGSIEWEEQTSDELFSTSIARSSFTVATRHADSSGVFSFGMYDSSGVLVSRVTNTNEEYPENIRDGIQKLWTTVSARASHLINFLDQALNALEEGEAVSDD
jgi:hypothetical protein